MSNNKNFNIIISDTVYEKINKLKQTKNKPKLMLRIKIQGGGCSEFMYQYELVEEYNSDDFIAEKYDAKVLIDKDSQDFLKNCIVEYKEELGRSHFKITNPAAQGKCGCGASFSI